MLSREEELEDALEILRGIIGSFSKDLAEALRREASACEKILLLSARVAELEENYEND